MIDVDQYKFPHKQEPRVITEEQRRQAAETLAYLENLPWRPHGMEW